jgi:hypothetical protein
MKPLYAFAQMCVNAGNLVTAAFWILLGAPLIFAAVWLVWYYGLNWFSGLAAGVLAFIGACLVVQAAGLVLETEPKNQPPLQRPFAFESTRDKKRRERQPEG